MHVRLQVGYLYDWLLIERLILHNGRKGYLGVCARATRSGPRRAVYVSAAQWTKGYLLHTLISVDLTPPSEVMALMSHGLILEERPH